MAIQTEPTQQKAKYLRIKVVDSNAPDDAGVNVKMPIGLVKWGMKVAQQYSPELQKADFDWDTITAAIDAGELGKLVEVHDAAKHQTVEIWVE